MSPGILRWFKCGFIAALLLPLLVGAAPLRHELYHLQGEHDGPTVLVVGGIQGDEPGGFTAASMLVTNYKITQGNVWVIPNLNFISIVKSSRGLFGDMNRKFKSIELSDPDFEAIDEVKRLIRDDKVDLVLNLHDGSGFYYKNYVDELHNPNRWGQCIVIDQSYLKDSMFPDLQSLGEKVAQTVNSRFDKQEHYYKVKNTETRAGNLEMQKTLTYYAVNNKKSAFGLEVSKSFQTHERVYFHLSLIEEFFHNAGLEFTRDFALTKADLGEIIGKNLALSLYQKRIALELDDIRSDIRYFPIRRDGDVLFESNNPLLAVVKQNDYYRVTYGNRPIARLYPQFFDYDETLDHINITVDGMVRRADIGSVVNVKKNFVVQAREGYRVNVIGLVSRKKSEDDIVVSKADLLTNYSLDDKKNIYRVELYQGEKFSGMVLVRFTN